MYESCQGFIDDISFLKGLFVVESQFNVNKFSIFFYVFEFLEHIGPKSMWGYQFDVKA